MNNTCLAAEICHIASRITKVSKHRLDGVRGHQLLLRNVSRKIPALYSTEDDDDPIVWVKLFSPYSRATRYITEYDPRQNLAFGWADLGHGELGYININKGMHKGGLPLVERG